MYTGLSVGVLIVVDMVGGGDVWAWDEGVFEGVGMVQDIDVVPASGVDNLECSYWRGSCKM